MRRVTQPPLQPAWSQDSHRWPGLKEKDTWEWVTYPTRVLARCATYGAFERSPYRNSRITHAMTPWNQDPQGAFLRCHSSSHALGSVRVLISMRPCHPSRDPPPRRARRAPRARDFVTRVCETIAAMRAHAAQGGTPHIGHSAIVSTPHLHRHAMGVTHVTDM